MSDPDGIICVCGSQMVIRTAEWKGEEFNVRAECPDCGKTPLDLLGNDGRLMPEFDRCETCKHWRESPTKLLASTMTPEGSYGGRVEMPGTWGDCKAIMHLSDDSHAGPNGVPHPDLAWREKPLDPETVMAYLADGSGYFASITTRNDFGCVLHEGPPDA